MNGKHSRDERTGPDLAGQTNEGHEQEQRVDAMKEQAGAMKARRIQTVEFDVHHPRQPGQREPVGAMKGRKRPSNTLAGQTEPNL